MVTPDWLQVMLAREGGRDGRAVRLSHAHSEGLECVRVEGRGGVQHASVSLSDSLLVFHETGGCQFDIRSQGHAWRYVAEAGSFDYLPAGCYAAIVTGPQVRRMVVVRIPEAFEHAVQEDEEWVRDLWPRPGLRDSRLRALLGSLLAASVAAGTWAVILSAALTNRLYERIYGRARQEAAVLTRTMRRLIAEYVEENIGHPAQLEAVAELTGLGRTQFGKAFVAAFGSSLHRYVTLRRLAIAAERLESPEVSLTQLAHDLGFSSHAHFSTTFRQHYAHTPSAFRRLSMPERWRLRQTRGQPAEPCGLGWAR